MTEKQYVDLYFRDLELNLVAHKANYKILKERRVL